MPPNGDHPEVLVIDGDKPMRHLLRLILEDAGYLVRESTEGRAGVIAAAHHKPIAVMLDLRLPDMPGLQVLQRLREWSSVPVLVVSGLAEEKSKIEALDAGADDYLTKPFGAGELLARLRALLRRNAPADVPDPIRFGDIEVDRVYRRVRKAGEIVRLTTHEYALLHLLVEHRGKVLAHAEILRAIWGPNAATKTHYLRVFMMRLRQKIEDCAETPRHLVTEPGIGYRLVTDPN
ncbi:MAG TPA: response regulator [Opitutaceae bacterium]|nr:response regulator [Opitutaceae bacterium]